MKVLVPAEAVPGERRVAMLPDAVPLLLKAGLTVTVQSGAGLASLATDDAYAAAGAEVAADPDPGTADVVLHVRPLDPALVKRLRPGALTLGLGAPSTALDSVRALRDARTTAFAMELVPRISRAQSMDALTSQALVAGYRCVLEAAMRLPRFFPLFMTAAGTVPPAKVLVLGAGVAGLQAIATARRLGAVVSAYDVRPASADEVRSMGATFIELDLESLEGSGGYAREMTEDRAARQRELLTPHVTEADVLITTAAVPGRRAPLLVTRQMLAGMRPGSVVVDLAAETGGNVEGSVAGAEVTLALGAGPLSSNTPDGAPAPSTSPDGAPAPSTSPDGAPAPSASSSVSPAHGAVTIVGMKDAASTMPADASRLYARNVANLLLLMTKDGQVIPDFDDEVVAGSCLTHDGVIRHEPTAALVAETEGEGA